jgi:hypothetical protein
LDEYNISNNFDKAIKQKISKAIKDPIFLKPIENHISGFSRVEARAMFHYLFNAYGNITPLRLDDNDTMMKEHWDAATPIIYLFSKNQDGVYKTDAGNVPYTIKRVLVITFNHVFCLNAPQCQTLLIIFTFKKNPTKEGYFGSAIDHSEFTSLEIFLSHQSLYPFKILSLVPLWGNHTLSRILSLQFLLFLKRRRNWIPVMGSIYRSSICMPLQGSL